MQYFDACRENGITTVVNPRLIAFWNRGYHLFNNSVTTAQGAAIRRFLDWAKKFR